MFCKKVGGRGRDVETGLEGDALGVGREQVRKLVFYAQSTSAVILGQLEENKKVLQQ